MPATSLSPGPDPTPPVTESASSRKAARRTGREYAKNTALSISPVADDHATLREILGELAWRVASAGSCREALEQLQRKQVAVIFCESALEDGTWKDILAHIRGDASPPVLIVTSRLADDYLWAEVLNLGGYDVLAKPFSQTEVRHLLTTVSLWPAASSPRGQTAGAA